MYSKTIKVLKGKKIKSKETDHRVFFFFFLNQTVERSSDATVSSAGVTNEGGR